MNERPKRIDRRWAYKIDPGMRLAEEICERESPSVEDFRDLITQAHVAVTNRDAIRLKESIWH